MQNVKWEKLRLVQVEENNYKGLEFGVEKRQVLSSIAVADGDPFMTRILKLCAVQCFVFLDLKTK